MRGFLRRSCWAGAVAVIALCGVLAAHTLGYAGIDLATWAAVVDEPHDHDHGHPHHHGAGTSGAPLVGHGHLVPLSSAGLAAMVAVVAVASVVAYRRRALPRPRLGALLTAQLLLYLVLEVGERIAQGLGPGDVAGDPRLVAGLVVLVPVGVVLHRLTGLAAEGLEVLVGLLVASVRPAGRSQRPCPVGAHPSCPHPWDWSFQARRGPPVPRVVCC